MSIAQTQQVKMSQSIEDVLRSLDKRAEAHSEKGSQGGSTTHPVKNVDDGLEDAREGFRSSENSKDVKEDQPAGVDNTTPGTPGGQASVQMNIGITSKETGDAEHGTASAKAGKNDPGSAHPARTDNKELDGEKYSSLYEQLQAVTKQASVLGNELVAEIAAQTHEEVKQAQHAKSLPAIAAAAQPVPAPAAAAPVKAAEAKPAEAAEVEAGAKLAEASQPAFDKQAVDNQLVDALARTIISGQEAAVKVAEVLRGYADQQAKQAEFGGGGGEGGPPKHEPGEGPSQEKREDAGNGGPPSHPTDSGSAHGDAGHASGQAPAGNEALLMQLLQLILGGQHMGGQDAAAAMMAPGDAGGAGGAPPAAPGADPMAAGGPPAGGGGGDDMAMLQQVLQDTGSNPAELEAAAAHKQAQLMQERDIAPVKGEPVWTAKTAADKAKYAAMRNYIEELLGRKSR